LIEGIMAGRENFRSGDPPEQSVVRAVGPSSNRGSYMAVPRRTAFNHWMNRTGGDSTSSPAGATKSARQSSIASDSVIVQFAA
jgi:hypothetical protein